jgi:tight adherence protein B
MTIQQIGTAVFAAVFLSLVALFIIARDRLARRNQRIRRRMRQVLEGDPQPDDAGYIVLRDNSLSHIPFLDRLLARFAFTRHLQQLIDEAGLPIKAGDLILGSMSMAGLIWLVFSGRLTGPEVSAILGGLAGMAPYLWVIYQRRKRIERYESLMPEAIDLMVNALKSGFSLEASLSLVAQEIPDPIGSEFAITFEEQNLGLDFVQALENMYRRLPSEDLRIMTTAISVQKRTGGNLTEVLSKISGMIRERMQLRREVRIFTAQGRFSGIVLTVLPIVLALILTFLNPEYLKILFIDPVGQYLLATALTLQILGFLVIRRIIRLKF